MPAAHLPADERSRLALLKALDVLDTSPEGFSESVSAAAASIANTPIAAISLIDADRQWFKASCGIDVKETARTTSFCAHAILESAPMVIADARLDARFCDHPDVAGGGPIRFYAGFQLVVCNRTVGALCVVDDRVRELSDRQLRRLTYLAEATAAWLEWRASEQRT